MLGILAILAVAILIYFKLRQLDTYFPGLFSNKKDDKD